MESVEDQIEEGEILIRRIPPSSEKIASTCLRKDGLLRATSVVMSTRSGEEDLSCSRLRFTSPRHLLNDLRNDNIDPVGWHVCQFFISDVKEVGLKIKFTPTDRDPGHCSITSEDGLAYPKKKAQKLARRTRILMGEEIERLSEN